jgi:hypothetical protein
MDAGINIEQVVNVCNLAECIYGMRIVNDRIVALTLDFNGYGVESDCLCGHGACFVPFWFPILRGGTSELCGVAAENNGKLDKFDFPS